VADGTEAHVFEINPEPTTVFTVQNEVGSSRQVVSGQAVYARVSLARERELAFWHDTAPMDRLYLSGLEVSQWPMDEPVELSVGGSRWGRSRSILRLSTVPTLTLYRPSHPRVQGAWLAYKATGTSGPLCYDKQCEDVRRFASFLTGRRASFLWKDTFTDDSRLSRLYFGGDCQHREATGIEQPVPLGRSREALLRGREVVERLPDLFVRFRGLHPAYNVEWIASPLWYANAGFLDDKLALACVSLERLAAAHHDALKQDAVRSSKKAFLSREQSRALREALKRELRLVGVAHQIPEETVGILDKKIDNIHQIPNADKLARVFADVGISLTAAEQRVLHSRNECMHGRATLADTGDGRGSGDEALRFDTLRTLINRAMLSLVGYDGPYVDYSERPAEGNFPIKMMQVPERAQPS
jgi:hypothetical protein